VKRHGRVVLLKDERRDEYVRLHRAVWPGVLETIAACNIRNYSIYLQRLGDGRLHLFSYFEYHGSDFAADMRKMAADPETQRWWKLTDPCQEPLASPAGGEWWTEMDEVFHCD